MKVVSSIAVCIEYLFGVLAGILHLFADSPICCCSGSIPTVHTTFSHIGDHSIGDIKAKGSIYRKNDNIGC